MKTSIIEVEHPIQEAQLLPAADALRQGELVAFPTETVYGLGANAFLPAAVEQIFQVKGRPQDNPLIVHLFAETQLDEVAEEIPDMAYQLIQAFSPGPLTFILKRKKTVPSQVSAGLDTVAIRFPKHPTAQTLLALAKVPVVAPSANISGRPSPTRAWHVEEDFLGKIAFLIKDGQSEVGIESTVLDLTAPQPVILRPGMITADMIAKVIKIRPLEATLNPETVQLPKAPGMKYKHYAPQGKVYLLRQDDLKLKQKLGVWIKQQLEQSQKPKLALFASRAFTEELAGLAQLDFSDLKKRLQDQKEERLYCWNYAKEASEIAATKDLYAALRCCDLMGVDIILAETIGTGAYMNRLYKAAGGNYFEA